MRNQYQSHSRFVGAWIEQAGRGLTCDRLLDLHQQAIRSIWRSARTSINDVTLDAVLERVVINARDHFRWLPALPIVDNSIDVSVFRAQCGRIKPGDVRKALRFIITEFLAINGNMTGEALTREMHRSLSKIHGKKHPHDSKKKGESAK